MSLQIWLPLNGNLENQGLTDIEATNAGATGNANGKIGSCYYFNGTSSRIGFPEIAISYPISICAWIKGETITASGTEYILSYNTPTGGTSGHAIGFGTYTGKLSIWHGGTVHSYGTALTNNIWYHVAAVVTESSYGLYLNGNLVLSGSGTQTVVNSKCITIGARSNNSGGGAAGAAYFFKGFMNDVRIYDHALSAKEVRELAKGLVLHYKLDDGYVEGTTNQVTTVDGLSNTCYNGATNKYGYGANTDMYKTQATLEGRTGTKVYMGTDGLNAYPYVYFDNFNQSGTTIKTLSFDYYPTVLDSLIPYSYNGTYNWTCYVNGAKFTATNSSQRVLTGIKIHQWNHIEITAIKYDTTSTARGVGYIRIGSAKHTSDTSNFWFFANVQVEEKDHATPYVGGPGLTRTPTTVYDSSGFGYNGTPANVETSDSSARYSRCLKCPQSASSILIGNLSTMVPEGIFTFNVWFKKVTDEWGSKGYETIFGGPSGFELESKNGNVNTPYLVNYNWSPKTNTPYDLDKWNMVTMVRTTSETKFYLNGELKVTASAGSIPSGNYYLASWRDANSQNYRGYLSDARIYSTALSADDILELYHTSASIDKSGSIYARELVE